MNNTIIFLSQKGSYANFFESNSNINIKYIYKSNVNRSSFLFKLIRKYLTKFQFIFYNKYKKDIDIKRIILFDDGVNKCVTNWIKKTYPNAKLILYYWNNVDDYLLSLSKNKDFDDIWSFNSYDCNKYKLKYNPQFYFENKLKINNNNNKFDILFIGRDKGRKEIVGNFLETVENYNLDNKIIIIEDEKDCIDYSKYLEYLSSSKIILDIVTSQNYGLTLRTLESIFYEKKLITNNKNIVNYDFYDKNNIFIIGIDDMDKMKNFINSEYKKIDKKIIDYYKFESWFDRFNR